MARTRAHRESLLGTMAYAFSEGWEEAVYRLDREGRCTCDGHRGKSKGCKHTAAFALALTGSLETGRWESPVQFIVTPWSAEELGLADVDGIDVRPCP